MDVFEGELWRLGFQDYHEKVYEKFDLWVLPNDPRLRAYSLGEIDKVKYSKRNLDYDSNRANYD